MIVTHGEGRVADEDARHAVLAETRATLSRLICEFKGLKGSSFFQPDDLTSVLAGMAKLHEQIAQASETSLAKAPVAPIPLALLSSSSDQLTLIRGIDAAAASLLNDNGIHSFSDIAALTAEDVAELGRMLGDKRRVSKQGWVEQAALLADGIETAHSRRVRAGDFASTVPAPAGHPVTGPKTAQVIDLAERRAKRRGAGPFIHKAAIYRLAAVAASAAVFVLSFDGADLIEQLISAFWIKGGCSIPLTALFSQCTVALLQ